MKFRDPETGEFKELYTKAADTLPVGTVVDFDGTEIPAGWEEAEDDKKGNFIKVSRLTDLTLESNDTTIVKFDKVDQSLGEGLSLSEDGGVKIGKGISAIRVNGQAYYYTGTTNEIKTLYLYRSTGQMSATNSLKNITNYSHIVTPSIAVPVNEGDIIYLKILGTSGDLIKHYNTGTFLIVEVIK